MCLLTRYEYGAARPERTTGPIHIEDLLRHCNLSKTRDHNEKKAITGGVHETARDLFYPVLLEEDDDNDPLVKLPGSIKERDDVPTLAQFRIAYAAAH